MNLTDWKGKEALQNEIDKATKPVLVLMAARWCGYCTRFLSQLGSFNPAENIDMILTDADDIDESLWDTYRIRLVPTLLVFREGKEIFRRDGRPGVGLLISDLEEAVSVLQLGSK